MSSISTFCHQHPNLILNIKSPTPLSPTSIKPVIILLKLNSLQRISKYDLHHKGNKLTISTLIISNFNDVYKHMKFILSKRSNMDDIKSSYRCHSREVFDNSKPLIDRTRADHIGTLMKFIQITRPISRLTDISTDNHADILTDNFRFWPRDYKKTRLVGIKCMPVIIGN